MNLPSTAAECDKCRSQQRRVLHHVRLGEFIRHLCTSCVLLSHPGCFCPSCFQVYDNPAATGAAANRNAFPPSKRIKCIKCRSLSHPQCVSHTSHSSCYLCPPCANPRFSFFDVDSKSGAPNRVMDRKLAGALLCAARIASASMNKAAIAAREEAITKAAEASLARKRAREALDNLDNLTREKAKASSAEVVSRPVNANAWIKDKLPDRNPGRVVKVQHSSGGSSVVSANLSSAVGLRHSHSEGFVRFVAETAASRPLNNGVPRKVLGTCSSIYGISATVKVENDNVQKLPLQNSNGRDDKSSR